MSTRAGASRRRKNDDETQGRVADDGSLAQTDRAASFYLEGCGIVPHGTYFAEVWQSGPMHLPLKQAVRGFESLHLIFRAPAWLSGNSSCFVNNHAEVRVLSQASIFHWDVVQMVERRVLIPYVGGSIPSVPIHGPLAQRPERDTVSVWVVGSSPTGSVFFQGCSMAGAPLFTENERVRFLSLEPRW